MIRLTCIIATIVIAAAFAPVNAGKSALTLAAGGEVKLISGGKTSALERGMRVSANQVVETGADGYATIQMSPSLIARIGENSRVEIKSLPGGKNLVQLALKRGSLGARAKKGQQAQIETPAAVAAVRGTEFIVEADGDESTVLVNEGAVAVSDAEGNSENVKAGNKAEVGPEGLKLAIMEEFEKRKFEIFEQFEAQKNEMKNLLEEQKQKTQDLMDSVRPEGL